MSNFFNKMNDWEKIFSLLLTICVVGLIFNFSASANEVQHIKRVIAGEATESSSTDNLSALTSCWTKLGSVGIKQLSTSLLKLDKRDGDKLWLTVADDNGKNVSMFVALNKQHGIGSIEVYRNGIAVSVTSEVLSYDSPAVEEKWKIQRWANTSTLDLDFGSVDKFDLAAVKNDSFPNISVGLPKTVQVLPEPVPDNSAMTFVKNGVSYRVKIKNMERTYEKDTDVLEVINTWQNDNQTFFTKLDGNYKSLNEYAFAYSKINGKKYPTAIGLVENQNKSVYQETFLAIIFIPEQNREIFILGSRSKYLIKQLDMIANSQMIASAAATSTVAASTPKNSPETTSSVASSESTAVVEFSRLIAPVDKFSNYPVIRELQNVQNDIAFWIK